MGYATFCSKFTDWLLRNTGDDVFVSRRFSPDERTEGQEGSGEDAAREDICSAKEVLSGNMTEGTEDGTQQSGSSAPFTCSVIRKTPEYTAEITFRVAEWFALFGADWPAAARKLREICTRFGLTSSQKALRIGDYKRKLPERDRELFERLRALRSELARENEVAPYVIFSNRTLYELCLAKPWDKEDMLKVSGVGLRNFSQYGEPFLRIIREADLNF